MQEVKISEPHRNQCCVSTPAELEKLLRTLNSCHHSKLDSQTHSSVDQSSTAHDS